MLSNTTCNVFLYFLNQVAKKIEILSKLYLIYTNNYHISTQNYIQYTRIY